MRQVTKAKDIKVGDIVYESVSGDHLKVLSVETKEDKGVTEYHISVGDSYGEAYSAILQECNVLTYYFLDEKTMVASLWMEGVKVI